MKRVPGPRGRESWKTLLAVRESYPRAFLDVFRRYGDFARITLPFRTYLAFHPRHVVRILKQDVANFPKSSLYEVLEPILGQGLVMSDGDLWKRQRRLIAPEFQHQKLHSFVGTMTEHVNGMLVGWEQSAGTGEARNVADDLVSLTFNVVGETLLGSDVKAEMRRVGHLVGSGLAISTRLLFAVVRLPFWVPMPDHVRYRRLATEMNALVRSIIEKKKRAGYEGSDILTRLLRARDAEDGAAMDDALLLDEVKTILLAGHETTSNALCWTLSLLSRHPDKERKLVEEIDAVLGDRAPAPDDLKKLKYTLQVFQEAMRLYPPVPAMNRRCRDGAEIDGYRIEPGDLVELCPYVTHRHPEFWEAPEAFEPERFENVTRDKDAMAYFPFLGGPRVCIGEAFAYMEAQLALALIYRRFRPRLAQPTVEMEALQTLRPKDNVMRMTIEPRG